MTKKFNFNIEKENANNAATHFFELYKLYKSYDSYINLLLKTKQHYDTLQKTVFINTGKRPTLEELLKLAKETGDWNVLDAYYEGETKEEENKKTYEACFEDQNKDIFSLIKSGECLICEPLEGILTYEKIFLLDDKDKLLIIHNYLNWESNMNEYFIESNVLQIGTQCKGKIFTKEVSRYSSYDGWDYDDRKAFAFFNQNKPYNQQLTSTYCMSEQLKAYDGVDIRNILTPMSFEEIAYRLKKATEEKAKRLTLHR